MSVSFSFGNRAGHICKFVNLLSRNDASNTNFALVQCNHIVMNNCRGKCQPRRVFRGSGSCICRELFKRLGLSK